MLNDEEVSKESGQELSALERVQKNGKWRDRLKFLRILKEGLAKSAPFAAQFVAFW